jgi:hypothetical protein
MRHTLILLLALSAATACGRDLNPVETEEGRSGITIEVVGCELDPGTGSVTLTYELQSEREYDVVLVEGRVKDGSGTIVGSSTGTVMNVMPGERYREEIALSAAGQTQGEVTCEAKLDLATEPFG